MKRETNTKSIRPLKEVLTLLTRLSGLGIAGFSFPPGIQREEEPTLSMENQKSSDKTGSNSSWCRNQKFCHEQFNCRPDEYHSGPVSIDLWFYLSAQAAG
jgi:hypothetical protein